MGNRRQVLIISAAAVVLVGFAISEHLYRRLFERRYQIVLESQRQLEAHLRQVLEANHQLLGHLIAAMKRTDSLEEMVARKTYELDQTLARLSEEHQAVQKLNQRLSAMENQMDGLQAELATTLETRSAKAEGAVDPKAAVELERIVVSQAGSPDLKGKVVSIHPDWRFVVVNLGWDTVRIGDTISIFRNEKLMAKAKIERVQEGLAAATLLPEWQAGDIQINDLVKVL